MFQVESSGRIFHGWIYLSLSFSAKVRLSLSLQTGIGLTLTIDSATRMPTIAPSQAPDLTAFPLSPSFLHRQHQDQSSQLWFFPHIRTSKISHTLPFHSLTIPHLGLDWTLLISLIPPPEHLQSNLLQINHNELLPLSCLHVGQEVVSKHDSSNNTIIFNKLNALWWNSFVRL